MGVLHSQPVAREYRGNLGNTVFLVLILDIGLGWVVPFFVAFATGYLWTKEFTYYEQAKVVFENKARVEVVGGGGEKLSWVSVPGLEKFLGESSCPMKLETYSEDVDGDGKVDRIFLDVKIEVPSGFRPVGVDGIFFFQYDIEDTVRLSMEGAAQFGYRSGGEQIGGVQQDGLLQFVQRTPLVYNPFTDYDEIYNISLFNPETLTSPADLSLPHLASSYGSRNETLNIFPTSTAPLPPSSTTFTLSLTLRNPPQPITHTANPALVMKFGLVQVFALWYIFSGVAKFIKGQAVENGFVNTVARCRELDNTVKKRVY